MPETVAAAVVEYFALEAATAAVVSAVVTAVTTAAISATVSSLLAPSSGQGGTAAPQVMSTTVRQSAASRRLLYGRIKAGGVLVYVAQSPDGTFAYLDCYVGEGPVYGIGNTLWLADELSTDAKFAGLIVQENYLGQAGQAASTMLVAASGGEWTTADVGTGMAHVVLRYQFDRNAFARGLILPAFDVTGRVLWDPRTQATALAEHASNPALALLDVLRSEFGPDGGVPLELIDLPSFAQAAQVCDELVPSIDPTNTVGGVPGFVKRYTVNGAFEVGGGHTQIVTTLINCMGGALVFVGGQYRLYAGAWRAPTGPVLTAEFLRADPTWRTHPGRQQRINTARGTYREPKQDWQTVDYQEQQDAAMVQADGGEIVQNITYPAVTNGATAQRLARQAMLRARSAVPLNLQCNWAAFAFELYDVVQVQLPELGCSGPHLIVSYAYSAGGGIDMVCVPHLASDYAWTPALHERLVPVVQAPSFNSVPLAVAGLAVAAVSLYNVVAADGAEPELLGYGLGASWSASPDAFLKHYEVQYRPTAAADWVGGSVTTHHGWQSLLDVGVAYDLRVRIVRRDDTAGPWAEQINVLVSGDAEPPNPPTGLSVSGTTAHTIAWTNPGSLDVMRARVYAGTVSPGTVLPPSGFGPAPTPASVATQVAEVFGLPATAYTTTHTPLTVPTYYWVAAIDRSGNASARTYAGVGN